MLSLVTDLILITLCVLLLGKNGAVIAVEGRDSRYARNTVDWTTSAARILARLNNQLVTIFTLIFGVVVSRLIKHYRTWQSWKQHGLLLIELHKIQGDRGLTDTMSRLINTRSRKMLALCFFILCWYYLGSQAILREYTFVQHNGSKAAFRSAILRSDAPSIFETDILQTMSRSRSRTQITYNTISDSLRYMDYEMSNIIRRDPDPHRNANPGTYKGALIPSYTDEIRRDYDSLSEQTRTNRNGWVDTSNRRDTWYARDYGLPVRVEIPSRSGRASVTIDASDGHVIGSFSTANISYLDLKCTDITQTMPLSSFPSNTDTNSSVTFTFPDLRDVNPRDGNGNVLQTIVLHKRGWIYNDLTNKESGEYVSFQSTCNMTVTTLAIRVKCTETGCYTERINEIFSVDGYGASAAYETPFIDIDLRDRFFANLTVVTGPMTDFDQLNPMQTWYLDPFTSWKVVNKGDLPLPASSFQDCIARGINTYFALSQAILSQYIDHDFANHSERVTRGPDRCFEYGLIHGALYQPRYVLSWTWLSIDFACCGLLLLAAVATCWLRMSSPSLDVFERMAALTQDTSASRA